MKAPAEVIFDNVNDFKSWQYWGPWLELDSTIVASYPEITSGVGASYSWIGKDGSGSMKTISLVPNKEIIQQIDFGSGSTPDEIAEKSQFTINPFDLPVSGLLQPPSYDPANIGAIWFKPDGTKFIVANGQASQKMESKTSGNPCKTF